MRNQDNGQERERRRGWRRPSRRGEKRGVDTVSQPHSQEQDSPADRVGINWDKGWIAWPRDLLDLFKPTRPYTAEQMFMWLVARAGRLERQPWHITRRNGSHAVVYLARGQLTFATRYLAQAWGCSEFKVRKSLQLFKVNALINAATEPGQTVITICDYDRFQKPTERNDDEKIAANIAATSQQHRKVRNNNNKTTEERDSPDSQSRESEDSHNVIRLTVSQQGLSTRKEAEAYAWEGQVIRLTKKHFDQWAAAYSRLELAAELVARDAWLRKQPAQVQKEWFQSTSADLRNKNQRAKAEADARAAAENKKNEPRVYRYRVQVKGHDTAVVKDGFESGEQAQEWMTQNNLGKHGESHSIRKVQISGPPHEWAHIL